MRSDGGLLDVSMVSLCGECERPGRDLHERDVSVQYEPHLLFPCWPLFDYISLLFGTQSMPQAYMNSKASVLHLLWRKTMVFFSFSNLILCIRSFFRNLSSSSIYIAPFLWQLPEVTALSREQWQLFCITGSTAIWTKREKPVAWSSSVVPLHSPFLDVPHCAVCPVASS